MDSKIDRIFLMTVVGNTETSPSLLTCPSPFWLKVAYVLEIALDVHTGTEFW